MTEGKNIEKKELSALEQRFNEMKDFEELYRYSDVVMEEQHIGKKLDSCHIIESTNNSMDAKNGVDLYNIIQVGDWENGEHRLFTEKFDEIQKELDLYQDIVNSKHEHGLV